MYMPNLPSALPAAEIMGGGYSENWTVPGYAHAPFGPCVNVSAKFAVHTLAVSGTQNTSQLLVHRAVKMSLDVSVKCHSVM